MKVLSAILIVLLGVASPLSLWAAAISPCAQQAQPQLDDIVMDESIHANMAAPDNDRHASAHETKSHHDSSTGSESSTIDCDCCGGCVSVCASSASAVSAIGTESPGSAFDNQGQPILAADRFHSDPDPDSVFRPPSPGV